jgi:hypothetical protein
MQQQKGDPSTGSRSRRDIEEELGFAARLVFPAERAIFSFGGATSQLARWLLRLRKLLPERSCRCRAMHGSDVR